MLPTLLPAGGIGWQSRPYVTGGMGHFPSDRHLEEFIATFRLLEQAAGVYRIGEAWAATLQSVAPFAAIARIGEHFISSYRREQAAMTTIRTSEPFAARSRLLEGFNAVYLVGESYQAAVHIVESFDATMEVP